MANFKYAFFSSTSRASCEELTGGDILIFDTEDLIEKTLGFPPAYPQNDPRAVEDKNCVVVAVATPRDMGSITDLDKVYTAWSDKWVGVYVNNLPVVFSERSKKFDFVLSPAFNTITSEDKAGGFGEHTQLCSIRVLPSRVTPEVIEAAKEEYLISNPGKLSLDQPITTVAVGYLDNWSNPSREIRKIRRVFEKRGGQALLTTSSRTFYDGDRPLDERDMVDALRPWLVDSYLWSVEQGNRNPYLAYLGLADEIIVTGDSLSMMSDCAGTGKPFRVIHGWEKGEGREARDFMLYVARHGARVNTRRIGISPVAPINTGLPRAMRMICNTVRQKAGRLSTVDFA